MKKLAPIAAYVERSAFASGQRKCPDRFLDPGNAKFYPAGAV